MATRTLEKCALQGWIPASTVWHRVGEWFVDVNVVNRALHVGGGVKVWVGKATDNEHNYILLMEIWMHRDSVKTFRGPLLCYLSTAITLCFSMIMHGPMLQGSVHNSWKLTMSQFMACIIIDVWDALDWHVRKRVSVPDNIQQLRTAIPGVGQHSTGHNQQPDQLCNGDVSRFMRQMVVTPDSDWFSNPHP